MFVTNERGCGKRHGIKFTYPYGLKKALTCSYDETVYQDIMLIDIFNKYGLKCTFNVSAGVDANSKLSINGCIAYRSGLKWMKDIYKNYEIAIHILNNINITKESSNVILKERENIEKIFEKKVIGISYPNLNYTAVKILKKIGIKYIRTVKETENFSIPSNFLRWNPTCHHDNIKLMKLAEDFINSSCDELQVFNLYGHSYEFDVYDNWNVIEEFARYMGNNSLLWYATNGEFYEYINAMKNIKIIEEQKIIYNNSDINIYAEVNNRLIVIKSKSLFNIETGVCTTIDENVYKNFLKVVAKV